MFKSKENVSIIVYCADCGKQAPSAGCDAKGCTFRAEALADAVRNGALVHVVCDETDNSDEDRKNGYLNFTVSAYPVTVGTA